MGEIVDITAKRNPPVAGELFGGRLRSRDHRQRRKLNLLGTVNRNGDEGERFGSEHEWATSELDRRHDIGLAELWMHHLERPVSTITPG